MKVTTKVSLGTFLSAQIETVDEVEFCLVNACTARIACSKSELPRDDDNIACLVCGEEFARAHVMSLCRAMLKMDRPTRHLACCQPLSGGPSTGCLSLGWSVHLCQTDQA